MWIFSILFERHQAVGAAPKAADQMGLCERDNYASLTGSRYHGSLRRGYFGERDTCSPLNFTAVFHPKSIGFFFFPWVPQVDRWWHSRSHKRWWELTVSSSCTSWWETSINSAKSDFHFYTVSYHYHPQGQRSNAVLLHNKRISYPWKKGSPPPFQPPCFKA